MLKNHQVINTFGFPIWKTNLENQFGYPCIPGKTIPIILH